MDATQAWRDSGRPVPERVDALLAAMTTAQKIALALSDFAALADLGLPPLEYTDSGNGVRDPGGTTALPCALALAATFDVDLAEAYGGVIGREARAVRRNVLLGPSADIVRTPLGGRAAEAVGEDPTLAGAIAAAVVRGVQREHVVAMLKHVVANNQEYLRTGSGPVAGRGPAIDVVVDDATLREVYLTPVRRALTEGGALAVMGSYNRLNGTYVCEHAGLWAELKADWPGFVVPDFMFAVRDDVAAARAGMDIGALDGPGRRTADDFTSGRIPADRLDDMVRRVAYGMIAGGLVDHPLRDAPDPEPSTPAHRVTARDVAVASTVLLRNRDGLLPLSPEVRSIAVTGTAGEDAVYTLGGSGTVPLTRARVVTPLAGLRDRGVEVRFAPGSSGDVSLPLLPDPSVDVWGASDAVWTGTLTPTVTGPHRFSLTYGGEAALYLDGVRVAGGFREAATFIGGPELPSQGVAALTAGRPVEVRVEYRTAMALDIPAPAQDQFGELRGYQVRPGIRLGWEPPDSRIADAATLAAGSEVAVVVVGAAAGEGMDRDSLALPGDQDALVAAVAAANPRTVVVLNTPGPVLMPWLDDVAAVLQVWYPGEQFGAALAAVLFGDADPGGRLPVTFPAAADQGPLTTPERYPGVDGVVRYDEGPLVGYRFYDAHGQSPLFPFGHGLSYGRYTYADLRVDAGTVSVDVTNVGERAGTEVVQVYADGALRGFRKVRLAPGETVTVDVALPDGPHEIAVGASSRDLRLTTRMG